MTRQLRAFAVLLAAFPIVLGAGMHGAQRSCVPERVGHTERIDVSTSGAQANGVSFRGPISADGRFVAFSSYATNLVPDDNNHVEDVFVRDRAPKRTIRVSLTSSGGEADGASYLPLLSGKAQVVAFRSVATNFDPGGADRLEGLYVHDLITELTERIPLGPTGNNPSRSINGSLREVCDRWCVNAMSADGNAFVFTSPAAHLLPRDRNGVRDVFVEAAGRTLLMTRGLQGSANGPSEGSSISADGRVVAFRSFASNLVPHDRNRIPDVFVRDRVTGITERVNVSSSGAEANRVSFRGMVSPDGRYVGFRSVASNLVPDDTNRAIDVFVHDRVTDNTTRISVASDGSQARARGLSWHVRNTMFQSRPFLSRNGRYAAFTSRARNLVRGDTNGHADVFRHDLRTGETVRVSVPDLGGQASGDSRVTGISADGRVVGFMSPANNLVRGDTNGRNDYFVRVLGASCALR
jgi:hypothetical protein